MGWTEGICTGFLDLIPVLHIAEVARAAVKLEAAATSMSGEQACVSLGMTCLCTTVLSLSPKFSPMKIARLVTD